MQEAHEEGPPLPPTSSNRPFQPPLPTPCTGIAHPGPLLHDARSIKFMLPALPFTILMPALSLLLVFRTNTGYSRWNEAHPKPKPKPKP